MTIAELKELAEKATPGPWEYDCKEILKALTGDWIVKGGSGEFYPCKPDIFEKTYERVWEEK